MDKQFIYHHIINFREKLPSAKDAILLLSILAVIGFNGIKRLQVPENLGYLTAVITAVNIEKRVGMQGYEIAATLPNGDEIHVSSPYLKRGQKVGGQICVRHLRDQLHGNEGYQISLTYHCGPNKGGFFSRLV